MALTLERLAARMDCCKMICVAGFGGLWREVNAFSIVDTPEIASWLRGGELVVEAGYITSNHPELWKSLVPELSQRGCAGLAVKLHRYYDKVPKAFIQAGNALDFPVFALPYEVRFSDLAFEIHKQVFEERLTESQRVSEVYAKLVYTISTQQDLSRTLYDISEILDAPVLLANAQGELLAMEIPAKNPVTLSQFLPLAFGRPLFDGRGMEELEQCRRRRLRTHQFVLQAGEQRLSVVIAAIRTGEQLWGFLVIPESISSLGNAQYQILESICPLLALHYAWSNLSHGSQPGEDSEFVSKVLLSEDTPSATVQYLCTVNGFDYTRVRICLNIVPVNFEKLSFSRRNTLRNLLQTERARLAEDFGLQSYPVALSSCFSIFLLAAPSYGRRELTANAHEIALSLSALLEKHQTPARIGISGCSAAPQNIAGAFRHALECIRLGSRLSPEESVYPFEKYQIYHLISQTMGERDIRRLVHETVEDLDAFDRENGCAYVDTLEAYIQNRYNVTKTAAEIHVHRNTLNYQLEKIRELLPLDMDNYENMLKLQMGIHALRLLRHPEGGLA